MVAAQKWLDALNKPARDFEHSLRNPTPVLKEPYEVIRKRAQDQFATMLIAPVVVGMAVPVVIGTSSSVLAASTGYRISVITNSLRSASSAVSLATAPPLLYAGHKFPVSQDGKSSGSSYNKAIPLSASITGSFSMDVYLWK